MTRCSLSVRVARWAFVSGTVLAVGGCSSIASLPTRDDLLPAGSVDIHECVVADEGTDVLLGDIIGPSATEITITDVALTEIRGLEVREIVLLDPAWGTPYASADEIPVSEPIWTHRRVSSGAVLEPGETANVVVVATVRERDAGFTSMTISFTADGGSWSTQTRRSFEVVRRCD